MADEGVNTMVYCVYLVRWDGIPYEYDYQRTYHVKITSCPYTMQVISPIGTPLIVNSGNIKKVYTFADEERLRLIPFDKIHLLAVNAKAEMKLKFGKENFFLRPKETVKKEWTKKQRLFKREIKTELKITNYGLIDRKSIEIFGINGKPWDGLSSVKVKKIKVLEGNNEN